MACTAIVHDIFVHGIMHVGIALGWEMGPYCGEKSFVFVNYCKFLRIPGIKLSRVSVPERPGAVHTVRCTFRQTVNRSLKSEATPIGVLSASPRFSAPFQRILAYRTGGQ